MIGLILASDKMADLAYEKLTELGLTVYLSIDKHQVPKNGYALGSIPVIINHQDIQASGPLHGLLSAHRESPMEDIFVLTSRMSPIKSEDLRHLYTLWRDSISDIYICQKCGKAEPLCGIYTYSSLRQIDKTVASGHHGKSTDNLQYHLKRLNTCYLHLPGT